MIAKIFNFLPELEHAYVKVKRRHFFNTIIKQMNGKPTLIDIMFGQDKFFCPPVDIVMIDECVILHVYPDFHGKQYHFYYSIYQIGSQLKIAVFLDGDASTAPIFEGQNEIEKLWFDVLPEAQERNGVLMYQWNFVVPTFFDSWKDRERFAVGMRHMHFRMLRIVHDGTSVMSNHFVPKDSVVSLNSETV